MRSFVLTSPFNDNVLTIQAVNLSGVCLKALIFAGGLGTRMREETEFVPKPMVQIGGRPVLWHIMKIYASQGIRDFVILTGYKSEIIKNYFLNFEAINRNFSLNTKSGQVDYFGSHLDDWNVTVLDTGLDSQTGLRLSKARELLDSDDTFMCTYGDGLAPVDLKGLLKKHDSSGALGTITVTKPVSRFGVVDLAPDGLVENFREKQAGQDFVNMGFMVFQREALDHLGYENEALETGLLNRLALAGGLHAHIHEAFWEPMDTFREFQHLNNLWEVNSAPWKIWED